MRRYLVPLILIVSCFITIGYLSAGLVTVDSYSEANVDDGILFGADYYTEIGQSFISSSAVTLDSCRFMLARYSSPRGE